jgi:coenzyme F420 hydrogenase subunit beta
MPKAVVARSAADIMAAAGSSYMACSVLETLNGLPEDSREKLGIVTTPCQALALGKMKLDPPANHPAAANTKLVLGLFCTWALSAAEFHRFLGSNLNLAEVKRFDIPPPPANVFEAYTASGKASFSLEQVREFTMSTCAYCLDMTAELADISVGSVEGIEGWNTVIVRSETGADLLKMALAKGSLETKALPEANLAHLGEASLLKKKRALKAITEKTGKSSDLLYLGITKDVVERLSD